MAYKKNTTNLTELLLQCVTQSDPMLSMLEWLCIHLMEAEVDQQLGAENSQRTDGRSGYRSGYRPRRLDTRMGTMYLVVSKVRQGGYIPFFVTERKRSEAMLVQVVQEAFVQGVSTRKMEKLAHSLGIENLSRSQVSEMTKGLNEQVEEFRNRSLAGTVYPVVWVDALYEKVRVDGRIISMAVLIVCGMDENGHRDIIAVEPMTEESRSSYGGCFRIWKTVVFPRQGLSFPMLTPGWFRQSVSPFPAPRGSAARCILCGIFWPMCRRKRRKPSLRHSRKSGWRLRLSSPESAHMM